MPSLHAFAPVLTAALVLVTGPAPAQSAQPSAAVEVTMKDYNFTPDVLQFRAGVPVRLRLTNTSDGGHSFEAPAFFAAANIAPGSQAAIEKGEVEVDSGKTVEIAFVPRQAGTYKFHCGHFMHPLFGMTGRIVVSP